MNDAVWQIAVVVLAAVVAVEGVILVAVMRQLGGVLIQLRPARIGELEGEGPPVGLEVQLPGGKPFEKPSMVLFLSPGCRVCKPLVPSVPVVAKRYPEIDLRVAVIGGDDADKFDYLDRLSPFAREGLEELETRWAIPGAPFVVAIDKDSRVHSSGICNSLDQLESLADALLAEPIPQVQAIEDPAFTAAKKDPALELAEIE